MYIILKTIFKSSSLHARLGATVHRFFFSEGRFAFSLTSQRKQIDPKEALLFFRLIVLIYYRFYRHGMPRSREISRLSSAQMKPTVWYFSTVEFDHLEWVFLPFFFVPLAVFCRLAEMMESDLILVLFIGKPAEYSQSEVNSKGSGTYWRSLSEIYPLMLMHFFGRSKDSSFCCTVLYLLVPF